MTEWLEPSCGVYLHPRPSKPLPKVSNAAMQLSWNSHPAIIKLWGCRCVLRFIIIFGLLQDHNTGQLHLQPTQRQKHTFGWWKMRKNLSKISYANMAMKIQQISTGTTHLHRSTHWYRRFYSCPDSKCRQAHLDSHRKKQSSAKAWESYLTLRLTNVALFLPTTLILNECTSGRQTNPKGQGWQGLHLPRCPQSHPSNPHPHPEHPPLDLHLCWMRCNRRKWRTWKAARTM